MAETKLAPDTIGTVGNYTTFFDLSGTRVPLDRLMRELGMFRRSEIIEWAATVLQIVGEHSGQSPATQSEIVALCLDEPLASSALVALQRQGRSVLFHRRQLWLIIQFASLVCGEEGTSVTCLKNTFGRFCLIASDCFHAIQRSHVSIDIDEKQKLEWQVALLLSIPEIMPDANALARAQLFWFDSMADSNVQRMLKKCGIQNGLDDVFLGQYGISLSEMFFALVTVYKYLTAQTKVRPIVPIMVTADGDWWGGVSSETRSHVLKMLSVPIDKFPAHLLGNPRQSWATDSSPLMACPFIEVKAGKFVCPDIGFLRLFFVDAIYWLLNKALYKTEWGNAFGAIYEWYVMQVLSTALNRRAETQNIYFDNVKFKGTTDEVCDGLILNGDCAFLFEFKGTRLTTRQKSGVSVDETIDAIRKSVASRGIGVGQLAKSIARIFQNEVVVSGERVLPIASKPIIVPILVWYEESACNAHTRLFLDDVFMGLLKDANIDPSRTGPVLLLSTHDLETLERCSEYMQPDQLLKEFSDFVLNNPTDDRVTFMRYIVAAFRNKPQPKGFIGEKIDLLFEKAKAEHAKRSETKAHKS